MCKIAKHLGNLVWYSWGSDTKKKEQWEKKMEIRAEARVRNPSMPRWENWTQSWRQWRDSRGSFLIQHFVSPSFMQGTQTKFLAMFRPEAWSSVPDSCWNSRLCASSLSIHSSLSIYSVPCITLSNADTRLNKKSELISVVFCSNR